MLLTVMSAAKKFFIVTRIDQILKMALFAQPLPGGDRASRDGNADRIQKHPCAGVTHRDTKSKMNKTPTPIGIR